MKLYQKTILSYMIRGVLIAALFCVFCTSPIIADEQGIITMSGSAQSYYFDKDDVQLSGTNTASNAVYFYIKGPDFPFQEVIMGSTILSAETTADDRWEVTIPNRVLNGMGINRAGTYFVYAISDKIDVASFSSLNDYTYATYAVTLKKFPLKITQIPQSIHQGSTLIIEGEAGISRYIQYYIFGLDHFSYGAEETYVNIDNEEVFTLNLDIGESFTSGEYFVVIQGQYGDGRFEICPSGTNIVEMLYPSKEEVPLFDVSGMHPRSAVQALTDAISMRGTDLYVTETFSVISSPKQESVIPEQQETPDYTYETSTGGEDSVVPTTPEPDYEIPEIPESEFVPEEPTEIVTGELLPPIQGINHDLNPMETPASTCFPYLSILIALSCLGIMARRK